MKLLLDTEADARAIDERFNGFHDAFFSRIALSSADVFQDDGSQLCSGNLTLVIEIRHRNYQDAQPGPGTLVRGVFCEVRDVALCFRGFAVEWSIDVLTFHKSKRASQDGDAETCFRARLKQSILDPATGWAHTEADIFTFTSGSIEA